MTTLPIRRTDLLMRTVGDETVLYDEQTQRVHALTVDAATVWASCDGRTPRHELDALLGTAAVDAALSELADAGLLTGLTRRTALRRAGVVAAGIVAVPAVTSVLAPLAAAAATPPGGGMVGPAPGVVYNNPFSTSVQTTGGTIALTGGGSANIVNNGGESYLGNFNHSTLTLTIPQAELGGTSYRLDVLFYAIESWDGDGTSGGNTPANPDAFIISDNNGATPLNASFANYSGANSQSYPTAGSAPKTGNSGLGVLGYGTGDFGDTQYTFSYTLPLLTTQDLVITFRDTLNQGLGDEQWGLRNLTVTTLA